MSRWSGVVCLLLLAPAVHAGAPPWPAAEAPAIPRATGYVRIPGAALRPRPGQTFRAVFDATRDAVQPVDLVPAVDDAASELNALAVERLPLASARFVIVFHGPAVDGLLRDAAYRTRYHCANPNLQVLAQLRKAGVGLYVGGQHLAAAGIDPATLTPDVTVASDAYLVLITYQNRGYALISD